MIKICKTKNIDLNSIAQDVQYFSMFYETIGNTTLKFSADGGENFVDASILKNNTVNIQESTGNIVIEFSFGVDEYKFFVHDSNHIEHKNASVNYISKSTGLSYPSMSDENGFYIIRVPADTYTIKINNSLYWDNHIVGKEINNVDAEYKLPLINQFFENQSWTEHCVYDPIENLKGFVNSDGFLINDGMITYRTDNSNGLKYWALAFK